MGQRNKALLEIGGETILARTLSTLTPVFREIIIVGSEPERYTAFGCAVHEDILPGLGSLGGLHAALAHSRTDRTLCVACDMPFLKKEVLSLLAAEAAGGWKAVVPKLAKGLEPLCAVYDRSLKTQIEKNLERGERRVRSILDVRWSRFIGESELRRLDPGLVSFMNINTPEALEKARGLLAETAP